MTKLVVTALAVWWASLFAVGRPLAGPRPSVAVSLYSTYTENVFGTYAAKSDWVWSGDVEIGYEHPSALSFVYSGNINTFATYGDLTHHAHRMGVGYFRYLGTGQNAIDIGAHVHTHLDRPAYAVYDYREWQGYGDGKWYLTPSLLGRVGYRVRGRTYPSYGSEDFAEHNAYLQVNRFMETRTTVRFELDWGYKQYAGGVYRDIYQVTALARIAQSLGTRTGTYLEYRHRFDPSRSDAFWDPLEGYEDSPFKDRYTYRGAEWIGAITYMGPWNTKVRASARYIRRTYTGTPALDLDGMPLEPERMREDRRTQFHLRGERPFPKDAMLRLEYLYRRNASNDPYYDYNAHIVSAGIEVAF